MDDKLRNADHLDDDSDSMITWNFISAPFLSYRKDHVINNALTWMQSETDSIL